MNTNEKIRQLCSERDSLESQVLSSVTDHEMEEYGRRIVAKVKEMRDEFLQLALADEKVVKEVDKIIKNGGCIACHSEQENKNITDNRDNDNQQLTFNGKEDKVNKVIENDISSSDPKSSDRQSENSSNLSSNQEPITQGETEIDKDALIIKLKAEIAELKKNQNLNTEQKAVLATKEVELAKLERKTSVNNDKVNPPKRNLISTVLPIGIVLVLLSAVFAVWRVKSKRFKKI
jgi:hypothetical protein